MWCIQHFLRTSHLLPVKEEHLSRYVQWPFLASDKVLEEGLC